MGTKKTEEIIAEAADKVADQLFCNGHWLSSEIGDALKAFAREIRLAVDEGGRDAGSHRRRDLVRRGFLMTKKEYCVMSCLFSANLALAIYGGITGNWWQLCSSGAAATAALGLLYVYDWRKP